MKVTYVADSTFLFEHDGIRILTDPWIGTTIYGGSWIQFPLPTIRASDIGRLDYIFISHIHEDHCDGKTIAQLDRGAKILLMDRKPNFVSAFLHRNGFDFAEIINVPPYLPFVLSPNLSVEMIDADPAHSLNHLIDSSLLVHWGGNTLYFANDNPPYPGSTKYLQRYKHKLALIPASGGSGYPACYDSLSKEQKQFEQRRISDSYLGIFCDTIRSLQPRRFCAIAGNHVVSGRHAVLNDQMAFLADPAIAYRMAKDKLDEDIAARCAPLVFKEGQSVDLETDCSPVDLLWEAACLSPAHFQHRKAFIRDVASCVPYFHDSLVLPTEYDFQARFVSAGRNLFQAAKMNNILFNSHIYVDLPDRGSRILGHIDGSTKSATIERSGSMREPYLYVRTDDTLLYQLLEGHFSWNIADAGCLLRYSRVPNVFDQNAFIALNFLRHTNLKD